MSVHEVAGTRPLLLIATIAFEREIDRVYTRGTKAQLWELPTSAHTKGLQDHPITYAQRVLSLFNQALLSKSQREVAALLRPPLCGEGSRSRPARQRLVAACRAFEGVRTLGAIDAV